MTYYIKLICGYRKDQEYTISVSEAHKAYYLFHNPEKRAIFSNGIAIKGDQIQAIKPDYHSTMGWNDTHVLDSDDWNELRSKNIDIKIRNAMEFAKSVSQICKPQELTLKLKSLKDPYKTLLLPKERKSGSTKELLAGK